MAGHGTEFKDGSDGNTDKKGGGHGENKGAANKRSLVHGDGKGSWDDTDNAKSGAGHGGPLRKLR